MMLSHFLLAGAQRSGTTLLYTLLDQHPEIEMARPLRPEPKFFLRSDESSPGLAEYEELFAGKPGARVRGEKSTSYMERSDVPDRALAILPEARVVFLLRDPVERALSNYRFSVQNNAEHSSLEDALAHEEERREGFGRSKYSASPFAYVYRGHYIRFLEQWEAALGRHRLFLMSFERLLTSPTELRRLFAWLGVNDSFVPEFPPAPVNAARLSINVEPEIRRRLTETFRESNRLLEERYGFDVSLWQ